MPSVPTLDPPRTGATGPGLRSAALVVVVLAILAALAVMSVPLLDGPSRRDLTVRNPTGFVLQVSVSSVSGEGVLGVGTVNPRSTKTFRNVTDQGDAWIIEFSNGGVTGGRSVVSSADLVDAVQVPPDVADTLRAAGLRPRTG